MNKCNGSVRKILFTGLLLVSLTSACHKTEPLVESSSFEHLLFGHFYGECLGDECIELFRLETEKLFEDDLDQYPHRDKAYQGNYVELSTEKFNQVKDLKDHFTLALLAEDRIIFGCPDCADQGGLYLEYGVEGQSAFWILDNNQAEIPNYLHGFVDKVHEKITLINN